MPRQTSARKPEIQEQKSPTKNTAYRFLQGGRKKVWYELLFDQPLISEETMAVLRCYFGNDSLLHENVVKVLMEVILIEEKNQPVPRYKLELVVEAVPRAGRRVRRDFQSVLDRLNAFLSESELLIGLYYVGYDPGAKGSWKTERKYRFVAMKKTPGGLKPQ